MVSARSAYNKAMDFDGHFTAAGSALMGAWSFGTNKFRGEGAPKAACAKHLVWPSRWSDKPNKLFRITTPASDLVSYKLPISFAPMGYLAPSIDYFNNPNRVFLGFAKMTTPVLFNNKTMCAPTDYLDTDSMASALP